MQPTNTQRGTQGRPVVRAERGEALVRQLMEEKRADIEALFARDTDPKASYTRAVGLAVAVYKNMQATSEKTLDEHSAVSSALWAFQRKLDPGTEVYFVPYGGKIQPQTSPQGLINLAYRSGFVLDCQARWVFQDEVDKGLFSHMLGSEEYVRHQKGSNARPRSKDASWRQLAFAYCVIRLKGGGQIIEVHDRADIEYYRSLSKAKSGLWFDWPAEAARKAVLKQALGRAPKSSEMSEILAHEAAVESEADAFAERIADVADLGPGQALAIGPIPEVPARETSRAPAVVCTAGPDPFAGDPTQVYMPGKKGEAPTIRDAETAMLVKTEGAMRTALDNGGMDAPDKAQYKDANIKRLATIRKEMRIRELTPTPHAYLDGKPEPEPVLDDVDAESVMSAEDQAAVHSNFVSR